MSKKLARFLKQDFGALVLALAATLIAVFNYQPGTWLTGWDNLHPEFNFSLNIKRSIFAVWQEYQGLGLLGGMGHASDLPRQIFLWLCSLVLPVNFLRYFYTFLMLLIGPLGVYFLILNIPPRRSASAHHPRCLGIAALSGGLFYLLNLATLQTFYVPFSAFTTHYAFLPWLILVLLRFLKKSNKKNLFWFSIVNFFAVPQAYIPTVFIVYLLATIPFLIFSYLQKRNSLWPNFQPLLFIFLINAFWLLPFLFFVFTNSHVVPQSKINQMASEEVFLRNQAFGNLKDVILLKGFWFDNQDLGEEDNYLFMLQPWLDHLKNPYISALGFLFFALILLGAIHSLKAKKSWTYPFIFLFIFSFNMLAVAVPPFSWLNSIFRQYLPFFAEIFRFPFTKFSILAAFSYAVFFGLGLEYLCLKFSKIWKKFLPFLATFSITLLIVFNLPSFQGNFLYRRVQLAIPQEYFQLFDFFKKQDPKTRIANFPQPWHWGWSYYQWDYTGSGFLWYGIEQPILDRAFDPWSDKNEGYYWEVSHALSTNNLSLFEKVLEKHHVNWLLLDKNVYANSFGTLQTETLEEMLTASKMISPVASFGKLQVFKVDLPFAEKDFQFWVDHPVQIEPSYQWSHLDQRFVDHGIYYSLPNPYTLNPNSYYFPFPSLFTNNHVPDKNWQLEVQDQLLSFKTKLPAEQEWTEDNLVTPEDKEEIILYRHNLETYELVSQVDIDGGIFEVLVPKYNLVKPDEIDFTKKIGQKKTCDQLKRGEYDLEIPEEEERQFLRLSSQNTSSCTSFNYPYLDHGYAYLLEIESRHLSGKDLLFYVLNETTQKAALEILLPKSKSWRKTYFILPSKNPYGLGYSLHFDNVSLGQEKAVNDIRDIKIYPISFNFLKSLKFVNPSPQESNKKLLIYSQSFDPGWKLLGVKGEHVLVNNWANGWIIDKLKVKSQKLKVIYLPQYLEYLGFALLVLFSLYVVYNYLHHGQEIFHHHRHSLR